MIWNVSATSRLVGLIERGKHSTGTGLTPTSRGKEARWDDKRAYRKQFKPCIVRCIIQTPTVTFMMSWKGAEQSHVVCHIVFMFHSYSTASCGGGGGGGVGNAAFWLLFLLIKMEGIFQHSRSATLPLSVRGEKLHMWKWKILSSISKLEISNIMVRVRHLLALVWDVKRGLYQTV